MTYPDDTEKRHAEPSKKDTSVPPMGYKWGTLFLPISGVEGRPNVRGEGVGIRLLQAGIDLQRNLGIRVAGQVLDAL